MNTQGDPGRLLAIRVALVVVSVALIVLGIYRGEALEVLAKGVRVCLECMGLG
jgi:hypothetical protein